MGRALCEKKSSVSCACKAAASVDGVGWRLLSVPVERQGPVHPQQQRLCQVQFGFSSSASSFSPCIVPKDPILRKQRAALVASTAPKLSQRP